MIQTWSFHDWLQRKLHEAEGQGEITPTDPVSKFKFDDNDDCGTDYEHTQQELFKVVMSKYPEEAIEFLNGIAQRGDEEVASLLSKLQKDKPIEMEEPDHPSSGHEIVPSLADTGYDPGGSGM